MTAYSRFFGLLLKIALIAIYLLAITPQNDLPTVDIWDKTQHVAAFVTLTILACLAWPRARLIRIAAGLALFGALIEFSQMIPAFHRQASLDDWLADIVAIAFGLIVMSPFRDRSQAR